MTINTPTLDDLKAELRKQDPKLSSDDPAFRAALVLLAALATQSTDVATLAAFTKLPTDEVQTFVSRAEQNQVFLSDGRIAANWFDEEEGGIAFWMDVNCLLGFVERSR